MEGLQAGGGFGSSREEEGSSLKTLSMGISRPVSFKNTAEAVLQVRVKPRTRMVQCQLPG